MTARNLNSEARNPNPVPRWRCALPVFVLIAMIAAPDVAHCEDAPQRIAFATDIVPILTRLGCNGGGCHGKASGQNGFRLSLLGFEPDFDYEALALEAGGRRLFPAAPERSLLLVKGTAQVPHGGGKRLDADSVDYRILAAWIAQGAPAPRSDDSTLTRIEVSPPEQVLTRGSELQLLVTAYFSDGTTRDVTHQSVYLSNAVEVADADAEGLVRTGGQPGLVAVMARFGEQFATFHAAVPFTTDNVQLAAVQARLDALPEPHSDIDRRIRRQWRRLGILPSGPADDATFLRRASLDICGTLPTPDEVAAYLLDNSPDKRAALIDRLLERPEHASYFALKWADILQNRGSGYSTSRQRAGTALFSAWIRDSIAANKPYDRFVSEVITASGSQNENPPAIWYRSVRKPTEYVESVSQAFLGVRVQCAQCHHHPTERWSQSDYFGLAAAFSRVGRKGGFADAEVPTDEVIFLKGTGEVRHPRTGAVVDPRPLGGPDFALTRHDDPRRSLARWMTSPENPFFARTMVNRTWAHFLGRGLVHPIDDARSTNPPSHPELLDTLAREFIDGGFDVRQLIRSITLSEAYGLESAPHPGNAGDTQSFARFYPRRLTAEVLIDGISQVLDVPTVFDGLPAGTRAIDLPDENVAAHFLDVFGRPGRLTACECERVDAPALTQALELVNSTELQRKLMDGNGYAARVATDPRAPEEIVPELFVRIFGRPPRPEETSTAVAFLASESDRADAYRNLLWSLLATNEFMFSH
ncbi:MAG: DUF1549 domain-containing protein [Planctomycetaceae bacterium]|nr:DUF1549 domain-containing protein [Planctomycetaceae bacterium]